jgi:hypothetical protein
MVGNGSVHFFLNERCQYSDEMKITGKRFVELLMYPKLMKIRASINKKFIFNLISVIT